MGRGPLESNALSLRGSSPKDVRNSHAGASLGKDGPLTDIPYGMKTGVGAQGLESASGMLVLGCIVIEKG